MKITITNNIALNGGDAAILLGMVKALRNRFGQDTEFVVTGTYPEVCAKLYPEFKWRSVIGRNADSTPFNHIRVIGRVFRLFKRYRYYIAAYLRRWQIPLYRLFLCKYDADTLNEYATSDYIISSGGTYLIEPYGITAQYIDYRISIILGKPLIQYTQSMGPFVRKQTQERLRWVFNRCSVIFLRDQKSKKNVLELQLLDNPNVYVVPDAAFALCDIDILSERRNDPLNKYGNVAISVRDWAHSNNRNTMPNYYKRLASLTVSLIENGYKIHFISTCQGISSYTDDNKVVDKILNIIPEKFHTRIVKYEDYLSIPRILGLLKQMDFIVATRLHMSILGLISGKPVFPIAYEFKTVELYTSLGYEKVDTIDFISPSELVKDVKYFLDWYTKEKKQIITNQVTQYCNDAINVANRI